MLEDIFSGRATNDVGGVIVSGDLIGIDYLLNQGVCEEG